jgi:hypothetical protein
MIEILEEIARESSNAAARIAAIKTLVEMRRERPSRSGFDALDELATRRKGSRR